MVLSHQIPVACEKSPIEHLPTELLGAIFIDCHARRASLRRLSSEKSLFNDYCDLLPLLQTCSQWRQIALQEARLWTDICLFDDDFDRKNLLLLLNTWLERTSGQPIDVHVEKRYCKSARDIHAKGVYESVVAALRPYHQRIRRLSGRFPRSVLPALLLSEMKSLESLFLSDYWDDFDDFDEWSEIPRVNLSMHTPRLTEINLYYVPFDSLAICNQRQLRRLTLVPVHVQDACALLEALPLLEFAHLWLRGGKKPQAGISCRVLLPALRDLSVCCNVSAPTCEIFSNFTAPNLETRAEWPLESSPLLGPK